MQFPISVNHYVHKTLFRPSLPISEQQQQRQAIHDRTLMYLYLKNTNLKNPSTSMSNLHPCIMDVKDVTTPLSIGVNIAPNYTYCMYAGTQMVKEASANWTPSMLVDAAVTAASEVTELTAIATNGAINFKFLGGLIVSIAASGQIIWVYIISYPFLAFFTFKCFGCWYVVYGVHFQIIILYKEQNE